MNTPVKNQKRNKESMSQLNLLLIQSDLGFKEAAAMAGITGKRADVAFTAFWRGTKAGEGYEMRKKILAALSKYMFEKHKEPRLPI